MKKHKVFGIGLQKTATSSLGAALEILGYRVIDSEIDRRPLYKGDISTILSYLDQFDAAQDNPWSILFKELHHKYPDAKFILTTRNENDWIKSMTNHFGNNHGDLREFIYGKGAGAPLGNESVYVQRFKKHNNEVQEYFSKYPNKLLTIDLTKNPSWTELCKHLNIPQPDVPFPYKNKRRWTILDRLKFKLRGNKF